MTRNQILNCLIAAVWIANGLFCKVLNLVPRHQEIVARIIGNAHAGVLTRAIGFSEIAMAAWITAGRSIHLVEDIQERGKVSKTKPEKIVVGEKEDVLLFIAGENSNIWSSAELRATSAISRVFEIPGRY